MKKILTVLITVAVFSTLLASAASAKTSSIRRISPPEIQVLLDGHKMNFPDAKPFMDSNNRVLVPIRFISEALGAKVNWMAKTQSVNIELDQKEIQLVLGESQAKINNEIKKFDTKAIKKTERTFVPLRFVSEALGETVEWDNVGNCVWIGDKNVPKKEDVAKLEEIKDYEKYFKGSEHLMEDDNKNKYEKVHIFTSSQFPLDIDGATIYDIWKATDGENIGLQIRYKGNDFNIFYLTKTFEPRYRYAKDITKLPDGTKSANYHIVNQRDELLKGDKNYTKFMIEMVDYIGFRVNSSTLTLLKNPF